MARVCAAGERGPTFAGADFVGRLVELDVLRRAVDDALATGRGSLLLVAGEAGIGKSRLADWTGSYAEAAGAAVRRGAGWEAGGAPAYWPWIQVIRSHLAAVDPEELRALVGPDASELVRLIPELAGPLGVLDPGAEPEGEQPRFRLFDSVTAFLRRAALAHPIVIVLDDVHWMDVGSLLLLRFCAREARRSPLLLVGALRDDELDASSEPGRVVHALQRDHRTLVLGGLGEPEVRALLAHDIGPHQAQRIADDVHHRSGGNPLFVRELGRLLCALPRQGLGAAPLIPDTVRAVVDRRLFNLPADSLAFLRVAAAVGDQFRLDLVEQAFGTGRRESVALLDHAVRARLVTQAESGVPSFEFTHALVREALYAQLPLSERAEVHGRIGDALTRQPAVDSPVAELAYHFLRAAPLLGSGPGAEYSELAGRQSLDQLAYEDAAAHFLRALDVLAADQVDERAIRVRLALGETYVRGGRLAEARAAFEEAAALSRRLDRPDLLTAAALGFGAGLDGFEVRLFDHVQIDLLEEALEALGAQDSALRAWTLARLSVALTYADSQSRRVELASEAVGIARRVGDAKAVAYTLGAQCDAIADPDHVGQRLDAATDMVALSRDAGAQSLELLGRRHRLVALLERGDIARADAEIAAYEHTARAVRQPLYLWYPPMWRAMRALMDGRLDDCQSYVDEAARIGARAGSANATLSVQMLRHQRLAEEGRFSEAAEAVQEEIRSVEGFWGEPIWVALIAPSERPEEARAALDRVAAPNFTELPRDANWLGVMALWISEACVAVHHEAGAAKAYNLIAPYRSQFALEGIAAICHGSVSRHLGMLAGVLERWDEAAAHFEAALSANRSAGAVLLVAHTLRAYGSMLIDAGRREASAPVLHEALRIYRELGMPARAVQVEALLGSDAERTENVFRRDGEYWTVTFAGRTVRLKDAKGLHDIAALVARPGLEIHVADLIAPADGQESDSLQPVVDERARAAYRARLIDLQDELEEAERFSDPVRAERARTEMDLLTAELASAFGLGGRARGTGNTTERARRAIGQRIRNVLRRVESVHPELGRHLTRSLQLGTFCSYSPERPTVWRL
jgi:tetratricopeptide (TPR) repeat protein